jgi:hypothetical protein
MFTGCATAPQIPPELQYSPPSSGEVASIVGSEEHVAILFDNYTAFILAIDGKRVMAGRPGWKTPIVLLAGKHTITAEFNRGVFVARADLELDAKTGGRYLLSFTSDGHGMSQHTYCDFWITDTETKKPVTSIIRASTSGGGGGGFVPIFIPAR